MTFANHRPTGVDADTAGSVYYSGRRDSDGTWGKIFEIELEGMTKQEAENAVDEVADKLLHNVNIEKYHVEIE